MTMQPSRADAAIELERRAHETRLHLLSDPEFVAGLERAVEDEQEGRVMPLDEFKRELGVE